MTERCQFRGAECRCVLVESHDIPHRCAHMRDPDHRYSLKAMYDPEIYLQELQTAPQAPIQPGRANPTNQADGLPDNALLGGKEAVEYGELVAEVEWLTAAEPGETELVPYVATCDAGNCDNETVMIVKTGQRVDARWLSVCKQHAKPEMDRAFNMLGSVHAVIISADAIPPEAIEG